MSAKHTPGPWEAVRQEHWSGTPDLYQIQYGKDGECVSEIAHGEANAHLIAAAPDLLEALEEFKEWVINWECEFLQDPQWSWDLVNNAIAKAKGETP